MVSPVRDIDGFYLHSGGRGSLLLRLAFKIKAQGISAYNGWNGICSVKFLHKYGMQESVHNMDSE